MPLSENEKQVEKTSIFKFWLPAFLSQLILTVEIPIITAAIARMTDAKINLSSFGVAFGLALLFEFPVVMLTVSTLRLVKGRASYLAVRNISFALSGVFFIIACIMLLPPVFDLVIGLAFDLPADIMNLVYLTLIPCATWSVTVGVRRFYQGILFKYGKTKLVILTTAIRLVTSLAFLIAGFMFGFWPGAVLGAAAYSLGFLIEVIAMKVMAGPYIASCLATQDDAPVSVKSFLAFYMPLIFFPFSVFVTQPIYSYSAAYLPETVNTLSLIPVMNSLIVMLQISFLAFNETAIAYLSSAKENKDQVFKFGIRLMAANVAAAAIFSLTPLREFILRDMIGLTEDLVRISFFPALVLMTVPIFGLMTSLIRAHLVVKMKTRPLMYASFLEVGALGLFFVGGARIGAYPGIYWILGSFIFAKSFTCVYLYFSNRRYQFS